MVDYDYKWCPICKGETHHTITKDRIICNACHTEEEVKHHGYNSREARTHDEACQD